MNSPVFPDGNFGGSPSVSTAGTMEPLLTPAVIAAASLLASAALALLSKFRVTIWLCAPATVTDGMRYPLQGRDGEIAGVAVSNLAHACDCSRIDRVTSPRNRKY